MKGRPRIVKKKSINTEQDPYLTALGPDDMAVCGRCGAIYHKKRWTFNKKEMIARGEKKRMEVVCPACKKISDKFAEGFVTIEGEFQKAHRDEIINLIRNREERAMHFNPLDRVIEIKDAKGKIEVTTTTEKLAQRIGQMLGKAFHGDVEYKWSSDVKLARVVWKRNDSGKE
ncbi:MAG: BCAM0308 family protein [Deltaproteobacteria bacterium]|nr:BCAM0308 family protein [Deltaproteobacteria bacterium]